MFAGVFVVTLRGAGHPCVPKAWTCIKGRAGKLTSFRVAARCTERAYLLAISLSWMGSQ